MDFHSLARRELQTLCKKNKIPANMTNRAMADALKALDHVEGLSGNPESILDTPKRIEILSPDLPRTTRRTSTRRKPVAETDTKENTNVSEISETPVAWNGRRRAAATSVRRRIETHMKEYNVEREEEGQKENSIVPVLSVRRSARLSAKLMSESIQKNGSRRAEAVKIAILSEEEPEDLDNEKSMEGSEISVIEENKVTEPVVSGEIFINNNDTETCITEESSVVDSSDTNPKDGEEAGESVAGDVVSVPEPVSAELQGGGSLASVKEKEKELHGLSERVSVENQVGASLVHESLSPEEICNSESKEFIAETSLPKASNPSPNKESVVGDLIGNEKQGTDSCKVDEDSKDDDECPTFVLQNVETIESDEGLVGSGEVSNEVVSELEEISFLPLEKTSEPPSLETRRLGLCPIEKPEVVDGSVELKKNTDQFCGEEPISLQSEIDDSVTDEVQRFDSVLVINNGTDLFPCGVDDMLNSVIDKFEKCDAVPEPENARNSFPTEALVVENCSPKGSSSIDESEGVEEKLAVQDAVADDNSIGGFGTCDQFAMTDTQMNGESEIAEDTVNSYSPTEGEEEDESHEDSVFDIDIAELLFPEVLTDFHSETGDSAIGASEKCDQIKEFGTVIEAGQDAAVSPFCSKGERVFKIQSPTLLSPKADHVIEADATATAATEVPTPNDYMENKSGSGDSISSGKGSSSIDEPEGVEEKLAVQDAVADDNTSGGFGACDQFAMPVTQMNGGSDMVEDTLDSSLPNEGGEEYGSHEDSVFDIAELLFPEVLTDFHSENGDSAIDASEKCDQIKEPGRVMEEGQDAVVSSFCSEGEKVFNVQSPTLLSSIADHVREADATTTAATDVIYEVPPPNDYMEDKSSNGDGISSGLHLENKISLPSSTVNPITTPTLRKSVKKIQTPGKSASKRPTPIRIMVFEENKENNHGIGFAHASPVTAGMEEEKKKVAISQKEYKDMSNRELIKMIKEKEQLLEKKRTALQTLNKN